MTGTSIERIAHEECGSSDGLQVFIDDRGAVSGWCFVCETYVAHPYGESVTDIAASKVRKTPEEIKAQLEEISSLPCVPLPGRKLEQWALDYYGIKIGLSEVDGHTPSLHYYPYTKDGSLVAYKARLIVDKRMWSVGNIKDSDLFGWEQAAATGSTKLFITEGECDAVALYQELVKHSQGSKWSHLIPAVVSLPSGASSAKKSLTNNMKEIKAIFHDVVLVFDQDKTGEEATEAAMQVFPFAQTVKLPAKDPNDCLLQGKATAMCKMVLFKSEAPSNSRLINGSELYEVGRAVPQMGLSWPWQGMTELTRGIRMGETYYLGAGVKMGKSELVNALGAHLIIEHGMKVFFVKPEEVVGKSWKMLLGKVVGRKFYDPTVEFDGEAYDKAHSLVGDKAEFLHIYQHIRWENLRSDILFAERKGCKAIFIDPITNLVNGVASAQANTVLQEISQDLSALAKDLDMVVFIFCHLKAPEHGSPHERGGKVLSHQFSGSRAMMRSCNMMIGLEGNKDPDLDIEERNMRKLVLLEDREFGSSGVVSLYWDHHTGMFNEVK